MKHFRLKSAFTMIELIFVIVIVGIIAVIALPRFDRNNLHEAADQVMSHIRYTQHLAMQDDKFDPNDANWHKKRWQLIFGKSTTTGKRVTYSIFSDTAGSSTGNPDISEIAKNPEDPEKVMSGGHSGTLDAEDKRTTKAMNLDKTYGIKEYRLSGSCSGARISFDYMGRPLSGSQTSMTGAYSAGTRRLLNAQCAIDLCLTDPCPAIGADSSDMITIIIEPETGFVRLKN